MYPELFFVINEVILMINLFDHPNLVFLHVNVSYILLPNLFMYHSVCVYPGIQILQNPYNLLPHFRVQHFSSKVGLGARGHRKINPNNFRSSIRLKLYFIVQHHSSNSNYLLLSLCIFLSEVL